MNEQESGEELVESGDDSLDALQHIMKEWADTHHCRRKVLQRYKDGRLLIHFHAVFGRGEVRWSNCCEVHFQSGHSFDGRDQPVPATDRDFTGTSHEQGAQQQHSVFVCPYEQIEGAERLIPSVVRLNALDYAHGRCWDSTGRSAQILRMGIRFGEVCLRSDDGKLNLPFDTVPVAGGETGMRNWSELGEKFPRNVVKSGPQIRAEIPEYAREGRRRLGLDDTFDTYIIPVFFEDGFTGLCVYVAPGIFIERFQVLLSPDDFEPSAI
jgi:hypothetical protein